MATRETNVLKRIMLALAGKAVVFRNNRGLFLTLDGSRKVRAGLEMNGSSDLIGWTSVEVTPDMVGQRVAIFTAIEVKTNTGRASDSQKNFISRIVDAGGRAGVARSGEEALEIISS